MDDKFQKNQTDRATTRLRTLAFAALLLVSVTLCIILYVAWWYYDYAWKLAPASTSATIVVEIPEGSSLDEIQKILAKRKIINDDMRFLLVARVSGLAGKIQAGEFLLPTGALPEEILHVLATARSVEYSITIPEGKNIKEIAALFAKKGWCKKKRFIKLCYDKRFMESLGFYGHNSLEGYLYPSTYSVTKKMQSAEALIALMVGTFNNEWKALIIDRKNPPDQKKIVTMASMIEKETGSAEERAIIAGVFYNRLKKGMRLQSDPTAAYGVKDFKGRITSSMIRAKTPYNTYNIYGLPPGPISNPGRAAMLAAIEPATTNAFYFVAKGNGKHQFSHTLREHINAINKYLKKKKK